MRDGDGLDELQLCDVLEVDDSSDGDSIGGSCGGDCLSRARCHRPRLQGVSDPRGRGQGHDHRPEGGSLTPSFGYWHQHESPSPTAHDAETRSIAVAASRCSGIS
jgi:hypothetical protein